MSVKEAFKPSEVKSMWLLVALSKRTGRPVVYGVYINWRPCLLVLDAIHIFGNRPKNFVV